MRIRRPSLIRLSGHFLIIIALALATLSGFLWFASVAHGPVGLFSLGGETSVTFERGTAEFRHVYEYDVAPSVPSAEWHTVAMSRGWTLPVDSPSVVPRFAYSSGHVIGMGGSPTSGGGATVSPARYWLLRVPLWATMLPSLLATTWLVVRWERRRQERAARRRGFEVLAAQ